MITHPQGVDVKEGAKQFITWLKVNKISIDPQSDQMRLYRSIWNSAWHHAKTEDD